jgi:hypothetical protein
MRSKKNKFLDTLHNNYEIQIPIYRAASPKTQVVQLVLLGMQGVKSGEIREPERAIFHL